MSDTELLITEIRNHNKLVLHMLKQIYDELHWKIDKLLQEVSTEEYEIEGETERTERWLKKLAYLSAKVYGEEHELTKHYRDAYKIETGKEWDE